MQAESLLEEQIQRRIDQGELPNLWMLVVRLGASDG